MAEKEKKKPSHAAQARYNKKMYDVIAIRFPKETAERFKEKCKAEGIPQAQIFKKAVDEFLNN